MRGGEEEEGEEEQKGRGKKRRRGEGKMEGGKKERDREREKETEREGERKRGRKERLTVSHDSTVHKALYLVCRFSSSASFPFNLLTSNLRCRVSSLFLRRYLHTNST